MSGCQVIEGVSECGRRAAEGTDACLFPQMRNREFPLCSLVSERWRVPVTGVRGGNRRSIESDLSASCFVYLVDPL